MINLLASLQSLFKNQAPTPGIEWLFILFLFSAVFLYGLVAGKNRLTLLLLATYPAIIISSLPVPASFLNSLNELQILFLRVFGFFVLLLFIFWVFNRPGFFRSNIALRWGQVLILSILNAGLWTSHLSVFVKEIPNFQISGLSSILLGSDLARLVWLILPILYLFFVKESA